MFERPSYDRQQLPRHCHDGAAHLRPWLCHVVVRPGWYHPPPPPPSFLLRLLSAQFSSSSPSNNGGSIICLPKNSPTLTYLVLASWLWLYLDQLIWRLLINLQQKDKGWQENGEASRGRRPVIAVTRESLVARWWRKCTAGQCKGLGVTVWTRPAPVLDFSGAVMFWLSLPSSSRRWPWRIAAGTQTAKDTSCRDLMTRVISPGGSVSSGEARPVSPGLNLLQGPGWGGGSKRKSSSLLTPPQQPQYRLKCPIMVQDTPFPPLCGVSPLPPWGADEGGGVDGASQTATEQINYRPAAHWDKPCCSLLSD